MDTEGLIAHFPCANENSWITSCHLTLTNCFNLMAVLARHATPRITVPRLLFLYPRCAQHRLLGGALSGVRRRDTQPQVDSPSVVRPVESAPHSTSPSSTQASDPVSQRRLLESAQPGPPPPVPKAERPRPRLQASKAAITLVCLFYRSGLAPSIRKDWPLTIFHCRHLEQSNGSVRYLQGQTHSTCEWELRTRAARECPITLNMSISPANSMRSLNRTVSGF